MPPTAVYEPDEDEFEDFDLVEDHVNDRRTRRPFPWLRMSLLSAVAVSGLVYLAQQRQAGEPSPSGGAVPPAVLIAPPPTWEPVERAAALYGIELPDASLSLSTTVRRHASGGREDTLLLGAFGEAGHARISVSRNLALLEAGSFYVDLVRRAAQAGLSVVRSSQSRPVATKFGMLEVAPVALLESTEQACLAFRFAHEEVTFAFRGWLCGSDAKPVSESQLVCLIDRLALAGGKDDAALKVLFAQADRKRSESCAPVARLDAPKVKAASRS
jgi:hypothetical protein